MWVAMTILQDLSKATSPDLAGSKTVPTLGGLHDWVATLTDFDPKARHKLRAAIATFAKVLGHPGLGTAASPAVLAPLIREAKPALHDVSKKHWSNIRSSVGKVLDLYGLTTIAGRRSTALSPEWQARRHSLHDPELERGLIYLMRYCSAEGIAPEQVNDAVAAALLADMLVNIRIDRPRQNHQRALKLWNKAGTTIHGWPQTELQVPQYSKTYSPGWKIYPPTLPAETQAYIQFRLSPKLTNKHAAKPIDDLTAAQIEGWVRRFAGALVHQGVPPGSLHSLADLLTPERFELGLEFFLERNGGEPSAQINNIAQTLKVIVDTWVQVKGLDFDAIKQMRNKVREERHGLTEKNKKRLQFLMHPENRKKLIGLPVRLAASARSNSATAQQAAHLMQMAVAIKILLFCPLRIGNLAILDRKQHITDLRPGSPGGWFLFISAKDVKNNVPIDAPIPPDAAKLIDEYLAGHQHILADGPTTSLFPGNGGKPKGGQTLGKQISATILEHTGLEVNPHLFRHFAAWLYLKAHPGDYETVRRFLGHRSIQTTIWFYCDLESSSAFAHLDAVVFGASRAGDAL